jgi:NADH pyrophosphatase NudC (nudix superfamily)
LAMTEQAGHLAKAVRFCPFCGTELQSTEAIQSWYATR